MFDVIKNKGKMVQAYQLGSDSAVIKELIATGKIEELEDGNYAVHSQETVNGKAGGEKVAKGDWIKVDGSGAPYPNDQVYFETNHRHIEGDTFEQIPKPLKAWDEHCDMCAEIEFLIENKGLKINTDSFEQRYSAPLWGTLETAAGNAVIVFYSISYDEKDVTDVDFNFVARDEFERTYSII